MIDVLTAPAFWICLILAVSDALRDKLNLSPYKWPNSGFRIMRHGLRFRRAYSKGGNAELEINGWRLVTTFDLWHVIKKINLYSGGVFVWIYVPTLWGKIITIALCSLLWNSIPKPKHWK